jgi:hypothetical protein
VKNSFFNRESGPGCRLVKVKYFISPVELWATSGKIYREAHNRRLACPSRYKPIFVFTNGIRYPLRNSAYQLLVRARYRLGKIDHGTPTPFRWSGSG